MTNLSVSLFGNLRSGYDATMHDHTKVFFERCLNSQQNISCLHIERWQNLMRYAFTLPLHSGGKFGVYILLNDAFYKDFAQLFTLFQKLVELIALRGKLIGLNEEGKIVAYIDYFAEAPQEVEWVKQQVLYEMSKIPNVAHLPPAELAFKEMEQEFDLSLTSPHEILSSSQKGTFLCLHNSNYQSDSSLWNYAQFLKNLHFEKRVLQTKNKELVEKLQSFTRQLSQDKQQERETKQPISDGCFNGCAMIFFIIFFLFWVLVAILT